MGFVVSLRLLHPIELLTRDNELLIGLLELISSPRATYVPDIVIFETHP